MSIDSDHSGFDPDSLMKKLKTSRFPEKLHAIAKSDETGSIGFNDVGDQLLIDWPHFTARYITELGLFSGTIVFKACLNRFGFRSAGEPAGYRQLEDGDHLILRRFKHANFHRDKPEMLGQIIPDSQKRLQLCKQKVSKAYSNNMLITTNQSLKIILDSENVFVTYPTECNKVTIGIGTKVI
jgi:hypothetical protein